MKEDEDEDEDKDKVESEGWVRGCEVMDMSGLRREERERNVMTILTGSRTSSIRRRLVTLITSLHIHLG